MTTIIVNLSLTQATAILIESALSFLGFGDSSMVSWGLMLNNAQEFFRQSWFMVFFPGMSIFLDVMCKYANAYGIWTIKLGANRPTSMRHD